MEVIVLSGECSFWLFFELGYLIILPPHLFFLMKDDVTNLVHGVNNSSRQSVNYTSLT